ncbi:hypothetical protein PSTEL_09540 [Paenibacillus stellifer]|uniref:Uncharacterized protein n=1 Tax=Paenibacillus stellifer TaxID=169760 RepID=A0A089LP17_9BACL|nr:hypothetical protein [Paenibacillus stellifer]AIQ63296.1 hypothetical protein PSTEL_09540 [Paenibacillus stellifer]
MTDQQLQQYIDDIRSFRLQAEAYDEDAPGAMVEIVRLLTAAHMYMGRISAHMDAEYARLHALRQNTHALTKAQAPKGDKTLAAELAVMDLRTQEAEAYGRKMLWRNELDSVREKIYELRMRVRQDMHIGGGVNG